MYLVCWCLVWPDAGAENCVPTWMQECSKHSKRTAVIWTQYYTGLHVRQGLIYKGKVNMGLAVAVPIQTFTAAQKEIVCVLVCCATHPCSALCSTLLFPYCWGTKRTELDGLQGSMLSCRTQPPVKKRCSWQRSLFCEFLFLSVNDTISLYFLLYMYKYGLLLLKKRFYF